MDRAPHAGYDEFRLRWESLQYGYGTRNGLWSRSTHMLSEVVEADLWLRGPGGSKVE